MRFSPHTCNFFRGATLAAGLLTSAPTARAAEAVQASAEPAIPTAAQARDGEARETQLGRPATGGAASASPPQAGVGGAPAALTGGTEASATDAAAASAGVISYPASFFAPARPSTASDMMARLPGFTVNNGDTVRGLGGAAGNVLIDGERPSAKSVTVSDFLGRIPAGSVERIDIIRGGAPGIDMQGQPVVANVVRRKVASTTMAVQNLEKTYPSLGKYAFMPRIEWSRRSGDFNISAVAAVRRDVNFDSGDGPLIRRNAAGAVTEQGTFSSRVGTRDFQLSSDAEYHWRGGVFRLNGVLDRLVTPRREFGDVTNTLGQRFGELAYIYLRNDKAELGGDYSRDFNSRFSGQIIGLRTLKHDLQLSQTGGRSASQNSVQDSRSGEAILRGILTYTPSPTLRVEAGGEGAYNSLDAHSSLLVGGLAARIPNANVRVDEKRAEGFVTANWKPAKPLGLELGLRYEISTISQTGDTNKSKTLQYPKPRAVVSWDLTPGRQLRFRVERTVGQLNFQDFAATASLDAGTVNAGNADLEPETAWLYEAALEQRFWGKGAVVLTANHSVIQKAVDLIPIAGTDAAGNIGDGWREEYNAIVTLPLDKIGADGLVIRWVGTFRRSEVTDPVTHQPRRISGQRPFEGTLFFDWDVPKWNSTFAVESQTMGYRETFYRSNEIRTNTDQLTVKIYWIWKPRPDLTLQFQYENINAKNRSRYRTLYTGLRSAGIVNTVEYRTAELKPFIMWRARKTF